MSEQYSLEKAFGPVLRDFEAAFPGRVWLQGSMLREEHGGSTGVSMDWYDSLAEAVAEATDYAQEYVLHEAAPGGWPECPLHPRSHPLAADVIGERAWWVCERTNEMIALIGELPARTT